MPLPNSYFHLPYQKIADASRRAEGTHGFRELFVFRSADRAFKHNSNRFWHFRDLLLCMDLPNASLADAIIHRFDSAAFVHVVDGVFFRSRCVHGYFFHSPSITTAIS
jgi:hypothetical protein